MQRHPNTPRAPPSPPLAPSPIPPTPRLPDKRSSTGQVAIHAALIPGTYKIILWGRNLPKSGPKSVPEPGMGEPGVGGNVSAVYDVKVGWGQGTMRDRGSARGC